MRSVSTVALSEQDCMNSGWTWMRDWGTKYYLLRENTSRDFPGGAVVKNPPANAGDTGSNPGPGRSHMPWSN